MNVSDIVSDWLKSNGYDGLYSADCGCRLGDLMPCSCEGALSCEPGVNHPQLCRSEDDFWIGPKQAGGDTETTAPELWPADAVREALQGFKSESESAEFGTFVIMGEIDLIISAIRARVEGGTE